ncbi:Urb2/Npa2 family-domain-containing protein [Butyriboletus roseoflavus]|nr:Urb2/Npa2 family-domain-containing protein [Butyriboletus roseoflavus]
MLSRKIRPQLGAKQSKIVTDTFPSWLSASQPLSTDEARAFARLLTSLTTKTVPRTYGYAHPPTSTESQKAESLAKPFAKHASYVLVAYVDAFNDPLCIINAETRRDLEPGLFALCEMVGEHSRDALMVSALDSGGKTILKSLWKEYEKQRYVGKG